MTFNSSMGFNITVLGQKVTVYEDTVGLDVTRSKATGVKSHIIDIKNVLHKHLLCIPSYFIVKYGRKHILSRIYAFTSYCFSVSFMLPWNHLAACR